MNDFQLYLRYIRLNLLTGLEYRGWPLMVIQVLVVVVADPISVVLLFHRFGNVGEWSLERIILVYAMAVTSFGLAETFCRGLDYFPWHMIRSGSFDRVLLRPRPLIIQIVGTYFHLHRVSRVVAGICAIVWCLVRLGFEPTPVGIITLLLALAGGLLLYTGVFLLTSGIAFFTIQGLDWIYILTNASYQVTRCPVEYLPRMLRQAFTFAIPMLVISYYPASAVCGWGEPLYKGLLAFPAGLAFLVMSVFAWRFGVSHYQSTGS